MTSNGLPDIREEPGWIGSFTRHQAEGAIPNGTTVVKVASEKNDAHPLGTKGTVLGSLRHPSMGDQTLYFVEWECKPRLAMGCINWKIAAL